MALQPKAAGPSSNPADFKFCLSLHAFACNSLSEPVSLKGSTIHSTRRISAQLKGGDVHHNRQRPVSGHIGSRWIVSLQGKLSVACDQAISGRKGVVSRDRATQVGRNRYGFSVDQKHLPSEKAP